jgi:hypothetical protein
MPALSAGSLLTVLQRGRLFVQNIVLSVGAAALLLWLIPPVRDWLTSHNLLPESAVIAIVALSMLLVLSALLELNSFVRSKLRTDSADDLILGGVNGIYPHVLRCMRARRQGRRRKLEVLGLTLYTAWPQLGPFFAEPETRNWDLELYVLDPEWVGETASIPPAWVDLSSAQIKSITDFITKHAADLRKRRVRVALHTYANFPAVHGFRVDSTDVFVSLSRWTSDSELLADPLSAYDHVRTVDESRRSQEYAALFDNWLEAARRRSSSLVELR